MDQLDRRVTRRSTDHGVTWSSPRTLGTSGIFVNDLAVHGSTVLALYDKATTTSQRLVVRRSTNAGRTWSAEVPFGLDVQGGAVDWSSGMWHLVSTDSTGTWRYRASADGLGWSSPQVIRSGGHQVARVLGVGELGGVPVTSVLDRDIFLSTR